MQKCEVRIDLSKISNELFIELIEAGALEERTLYNILLTMDVKNKQVLQAMLKKAEWPILVRDIQKRLEEVA